MLDLRSYKRSLGIKVTNPNTPYKELVKQRLNSSSIRINSATTTTISVSEKSATEERPQSRPERESEKPAPSKHFWGYLNTVAQKIFDRGQETKETMSEEALLLNEILKPAEPVKAKAPTTTSMATPTPKTETQKPMPSRKPEPPVAAEPAPTTKIIEGKRNSYELAKEIEKLTATVTTGPKVLDFSDGDDTVEEIIFELTGSLEEET